MFWKEKLIEDLNACKEEMASIRQAIANETNLEDKLAMFELLEEFRVKSDKITNVLIVLNIADCEKEISNLLNELKKEILLRES